MKHVEMICIGASAGGVLAIQKVLHGLGKSFKHPIVVVLHLPATSDVDLAPIFQPHFHGRITNVMDKTPIEEGHCYLAPPSYHVLVESNRTLALSQDDPVNFSRPSIDVLFESAAEALGENTCGIILTGANQDGAEGLKAIHQIGGVTIIQDPEEAEFPTMPNECLVRFKPTHILKLNEISKHLDNL